MWHWKAGPAGIKVTCSLTTTWVRGTVAIFKLQKHISCFAPVQMQFNANQDLLLFSFLMMHILLFGYVQLCCCHILHLVRQRGTAVSPSCVEEHVVPLGGNTEAGVRASFFLGRWSDVTTATVSTLVLGAWKDGRAGIMSSFSFSSSDKVLSQLTRCGTQNFVFHLQRWENK